MKTHGITTNNLKVSITHASLINHFRNPLQGIGEEP
jgi:hypothetical protein